MKRRTKLSSALLIGLSLAVGTGVLQAQAVSATVGGTLNCGGYEVYFTTERAKSSTSSNQYSLTNNAGSTYATDGIYLGTHIVRTNEYLGKSYMTLPSSPNAFIGGYNYVAGTRFTLYGNMIASSGTCDNVFNGTLYY